MSAIFFDLETSSREPIGQILNYCFTLVDSEFRPIETLRGDVRISVLELPHPDAILANRTNVAEHQRMATKSEFSCMREIHAFIEGAIARDEAPLALVGYNSARFDVPYLRTSFIRHGINPYFRGKVIYRDVLHAVRKLAMTNDRFPFEPPLGERPTPQGDEESPQRRSLTLENIARRLAILDGSQSHHALADVELLLELARRLRADFDFDVLSYGAYEFPENLHQAGPRCVIRSLELDYDSSASSRVREVALMLLRSNYRAALWINLEQYIAGAGRKAIGWYTKASGSLVYGGRAEDAEGVLVRAAEAAMKEFEHVTLENFYDVSSCDIEQDIYRLDMKSIDMLAAAIAQKNARELKNLRSRDAYLLYVRHMLAEGEGQGSERYEKVLREYALYRYGGRAQMRKFIDPSAPRPDDFHATLPQLLGRIEELKSEAGRRQEDLQLLDALERFYRDSEVFRLAARELMGAATGRGSTCGADGAGNAHELPTA